MLWTASAYKILKKDNGIKYSWGLFDEKMKYKGRKSKESHS